MVFFTFSVYGEKINVNACAHTRSLLTELTLYTFGGGGKRGWSGGCHAAQACYCDECPN